MRIRCSQCQAPLNVRQRETAFKVRCPKCSHVVLVPAEELDDVEVEAPSPIAAGPAPKSKKTPPASNETPKKKKQKRAKPSTFTVLHGVVAGVAVLVLIGGAAGAWFLLRARPTAVANQSPVPPPVPSSPIDAPPSKAGQVVITDNRDPKTTPPPKNNPAVPPKAAPKPPGEFKLQRVETAAVIDRSGAPAGTLFETKMLQDARLKWVERAALDQVFAEQNLQAIFSPDGVASRAALGKLIKADVIAVVRRITTPDNKGLLDLVVFDVRSGLRLMTHAAPENEEQAGIANQFGEAFEQGMQKLDGKIVDVCAVPKFLSQDLVYQYSYMAGGLARSVEGHLNHRKGLLLVELAEAKSLAQEAALAGSTTVRPLPLFVLGEYRNQGADKDRRVSVKLTLKRGEKHLGDVSQGDIAPDALSAAMKDLSEKLLVKGEVAGEQLAIDPQADVRQLVSRARTLRNVGQWHDSTALYEAAIAIDPKDLDLRSKAAEVYGGFVEYHWNRALSNRDLALESLQMYRRAMEHVDVGCRPPVPSPVQEVPDGRTRSGYWPPNSVEGAKHRIEEFGFFADPKIREFCLETSAADRQIMLSVCRLRAKLGYNDEVYALRWAVECSPTPQRKEIIFSMLNELKDLPHGKNRVAVIAMFDFRTGVANNHFRLIDDPEYVSSLEKHSDPVYREAAAIIREMEKRRKDGENFAKEQKDRENAELDKLGPPPIEIVSIKIGSGDPKFVGKELQWFKKSFPMPNGDDWIVADSGLYWMKKKGVADQIYIRGKSTMQSVVFDGRCIWFATNENLNPPRLMVLDLEKKHLSEVTPAEGLPAIPAAETPGQALQTLEIAPLEKGKVLIVGSFGRTYVAIATLEPVAGKKVTVIHEAREPSAGQDEGEWPKTTVAFTPRSAWVIEPPQGSPEAGQKRILIARDMSNNMSYRHALVVDPEKKTITVDPHVIDRHRLRDGFLHNGSLYLLGKIEDKDVGKPPYVGVVRYEFPGRVVPVGIQLPNWQRTAVRGIDGDDIYLSDEKCWMVGSLSKKTVTPIAKYSLQTIGPTSRSNHYGLLLDTFLPRQPQFPQGRPVTLRLTRNPEVPLVAAERP